MKDIKILILGIGNTLLADEGFGPAAINFLLNNYDFPSNIQLVDGATRGLMLMSELLDCDLAIILDIILTNAKPGTFYRLNGSDLDANLGSKYSMHQTSIQDILTCCSLVDHCPKTIIYAMEPFAYQHIQPFITEEAKDRLPQFCSLIIKELNNAGYSIYPVNGEE